MKRFSAIIHSLALRILTMTAILAVVFVGVLYYFGVFDISFIKRPEGWRDNYAKLEEMFPGFFPNAGSEKEEESDSGEGSESDSESLSGGNETDGTEDSSGGDTAPSPEWSLETVGYYQNQGYYLSDKTYSAGSFVLGKLIPKFDLPKVESYGNKLIEKYFYTYRWEGAERTVNYYDAEDVRYAIELYMGYIIYDSGEGVYLADSYGNLLTYFDDYSFRPAYARDKQGRPLFFRYNWKDSGAVNEDGSAIIVKYKEYFYLSEYGSYMVRSDYCEATDGRGLNFDFPAYYGITDSDSELNRYAQLTEKIFTNLYGITTMTEETKWAFGKSEEELESEYIYSKAFPFVGGQGIVVESYDEYEGVPIEAMYIINEDLSYSYREVKDYVSSTQEKSVIEVYLMPDTTGLEFLGMFYFDHGLIRMRRQIFDRYNVYEYKTKLVTVDDTVLVYADGSEFALPYGYTLVSYSDGILLLESDGKYGYMDYTGKWIADPVYDSATPFIEGLGVVTRDGEAAMIDTNGNFVIPFGEYSRISMPSSGVITAYSAAEGWILLQKMARTY